MRLDKFLKVSRLVPRRTLAQQKCEAGAVLVNGTRAKSSKEVSVGDEITLRDSGGLLIARVIDVPQKPVPAARASALYEIIDRVKPAKQAAFPAE